MKRFIQIVLAVALIQILLIVTFNPEKAVSGSPGKVEINGIQVKSQSDYAILENLAPINGQYKLRLTESVIAPGGYMGEHRHVGPGIRLIKSGAIASIHQGQTIVYQAGEHFYESGSALHALQNRTDAPARILNVELLPVDWQGASAITLHPQSGTPPTTSDSPHHKE
jgi:quercetin dioxygenase-like cupin family protein